MVIHHDSLSILKNIDKYFTLKYSLIGDQDIYLGAKRMKITIPNNIWCWSMRPSKYVQKYIRICKTHLKDRCGGTYYLVKDVANPFAYQYEPEVGVSDTLNPEMESYHQYIIGIMLWMFELVRIDIATEVSMLSSKNAYPREGHLVSDLNIMSYLKGKHNSCLDIDPTYTDIVYDKLETEKDWSAYYGDVKEAIPPNAPTHLGKSVDLHMMVDSNHG